MLFQMKMKYGEEIPATLCNVACYRKCFGLDTKRYIWHFGSYKKNVKTGWQKEQIETNIC